MPRDTHAVWLFACPECGFGHRELGHLLPDGELYCLVCHHEEGRNVSLVRWLAPELRGRVVAPQPATKRRDAA